MLVRLADTERRCDEHSGSPPPEEAVIADTMDVRWNDVFRRSKLSPVVFDVAPDYSGLVDQILEDLGLPNPTGGSMYIAVTSSAPLLDGFVISLTNYVEGRWPSRPRVVGTRPMRLLCDLLHVEPPSRRLKGEQSAPTLDELDRELDTQVKQLPNARRRGRNWASASMTRPGCSVSSSTCSARRPWRSQNVNSPACCPAMTAGVRKATRTTTWRSSTCEKLRSGQSITRCSRSPRSPALDAAKAEVTW